MSSVIYKPRERRKKHTVRHREVRRYTELAKHELNLPFLGLRHIYLSTFAQRAVDCIVGVDLNMEFPWVYISKEKIEDNLYLHSESSDFLPLVESIQRYPEPNLLICLEKEREGNEEKDTFYICDRLFVKNQTLELLEAHKLKINNAIINSLQKVAGIWKTKGSELEIKEETLVNIRQLYGIEIECEFPIFKGKRKFSLSFAYPENIQFAECLPKIFPKLVYKRRMTVSTQAAPVLLDKCVQSTQISAIHKQTQYEYEVSDIRVPLYKYKKLSFFLQESVKMVTNSLMSNAYLNICVEDYKSLSRKQESEFFQSQQALKYFRDIKYSRNKHISTLVWHPRISGLVAAAYAHVSSNYITRVPLKSKRQEFLQNVVLIWSYTSSVQPKLILYSHREITSLCFCPYNINILIGGCRNGQIIIWDLTGKLEEAEKPEPMLTASELRHRLFIESATSWLLFLTNVTHVNPTAISKLITSHRDEVTTISWLSSNFECTTNGKFINKENSQEPFIGGQFITCSLDGIIYFWDFNRAELPRESFKIHKKEMPVLSDSSPYQKLNNKIFPLFKIIIESPFPFLPLTKLLLPDQCFMYKVINTSTAKNTFERTYFKSIDSDCPREADFKLKLITILGNIFTCTWTGHDYDQKNIVNWATAEQVTFSNWVHDAPINSCIVHPIDNNFLLTVGGKIFAIWNFEYDSNALLWRKSHVRYTSGLWSVNNFGLIIMFRMDSKLELWDLLSASKTPCRIINQSGLPTIDIFFDCKFNHVAKETYFKTDGTGTMKLTSLMSEEQDRPKQYEIKMLIGFAERIKSRRQALQQWIIDWKIKHENEELDELLSDVTGQDAITTEIVLPKRQKVETVESAEEKYKKKDYEKKLHELISGKKKLKMHEIEVNKHLVLNEINKEKMFQDRLKQVLKSSKEIFESKKRGLLGSLATIKRGKSSYSILMRNELKQKYMENYYEIEESVLSTIQEKLFFESEVFLISDLIQKRKLSHKHYLIGYREILRVYTSYTSTTI